MYIYILYFNFKKASVIFLNASNSIIFEEKSYLNTSNKISNNNSILFLTFCE